MGKLGDKIRQDDFNQETEESIVSKKVVRKITGAGEKDKQISAKVSSRVFAQFTEINKKEGLSNNSVINMLINRYVRENKELLEED